MLHYYSVPLRPFVPLRSVHGKTLNLARHCPPRPVTTNRRVSSSKYDTRRFDTSNLFLVCD